MFYSRWWIVYWLARGVCRYFVLFKNFCGFLLIEVVAFYNFNISMPCVLNDNDTTLDRGQHESLYHILRWDQGFFPKCTRHKVSKTLRRKMDSSP